MNVAFFDLEVDVLHGVKFAEVRVQVFGRQNGFAGGLSRCFQD
jgi:hypothetical protein